LATGQAIVDAEVRELVRRRGIDPVAEPSAVARLIDEVISEYQDRAVNSQLPPLGDVAGLSRLVLDAVAGFGPLQPLLDDPVVEEIWINDRLSAMSKLRLSASVPSPPRGAIVRHWSSQPYGQRGDHQPIVRWARPDR
jgi:hypothetical protein